MKVKLKKNGDIRVILTAKEAGHIETILNDSCKITVDMPDATELELTSFELWNGLSVISVS